MAIEKKRVHLDWLQIIKACLGKPCAKQRRRIAFDIICVDRGIRQAFLFDYASFSAEKLQQFVDSIITNNLVQNQLAVVAVADDVFIVNRNMLLRNIKQADLGLIDVSQHLSGPSLIDAQRSTKLIDAMIDIVLTQLQRENGTEPNASRVVHLAVPAEINLTTLFGLMLEYPVLYWYEACSDQNCLDMVPLHVCKLTATLNKSCLSEHHNLHRNASGCQSSQIISSFSFPEALQRDMDHFVKQWHGNMLARVTGHTDFSELTLQHTVVTLSSVSM